jgi:hypothetical protein
MKFPPKEKNASRREKGEALVPKVLDQEEPRLMPPRQRGEILMEAVGERGRCHASGEEGLGGEAKRDIVTLGLGLLVDVQREVEVGGKNDGQGTRRFINTGRKGYVERQFRPKEGVPMMQEEMKGK